MYFKRSKNSRLIYLKQTRRFESEGYTTFIFIPLVGIMRKRTFAKLSYIDTLIGNVFVTTKTNRKESMKVVNNFNATDLIFMSALLFIIFFCLVGGMFLF